MTIIEFLRRRRSADGPVFVDLTSDYGFKAIFGNEQNKDVLLDLLRQLVTDEKIAEIEYIDKDRRGLGRDAKSCTFDVYCKTGDGKRIIIEMQHNSQKFFLSRSIFYSTFAVQDQLRRGTRDYDFAPVYMISFVREGINEFEDSTDFVTRVNLYAEDGKRLVARNLNYIYIELNKFRKTEDELSEDDDLDGMIYSIKHMSRLAEIPRKLRKPMFHRLYEASRFAAMGAVEQYKYIRLMTTKRDIRAQMDYKYEQGMEKKAIEAARVLLDEGIDDSVIIKCTGLTVEQVEKLKPEYLSLEQTIQEEDIKVMTTKRDIRAQMDYKYEQGMEKGKMDEKIGIAKAMLDEGMDDSVIAKLTGLPVEQISELKRK